MRSALMLAIAFIFLAASIVRADWTDIFSGKSTSAPVPDSCCTANVSYTSCMNTICSDVDEKQNYFTIQSEIEQAAKLMVPGLARKIQVGVSDWTDSTMALQVQSMQDLLKTLEDGEAAVDPKYEMYHNVMYFTLYAGYAVFTKDSKPDNLKIDKAEVRKRLAHLPKADQDWIIEGMGQYYNNKFVKQQMEFDQYAPPIEWFYKKKYPNLSLQAAIKKDADAMKKKSERLVKEIFKPMGMSKEQLDQMFPLQLIGDVVAGKRGDQKSLESFYRQFLSIDMMERAFLGNEFPWYRTRKVKSVEAIVKSSKAKDNLKLAIRIGSDRKTVLQLIDGMIMHCAANYALHMAALPSKSEIEAEKKKTKDSKDALAKKILPLFSEHTRKHLEGVLAKMSFAFPSTREDFAKDYEDAITRSKNGVELDIEWIKKTRSTKEYKQLGLFSIYDFADPKWDPRTHFMRDLWTCDTFQLPQPNDFSDHRAEHVNVSLWTMRAPKMAAGIMAHEIGHTIDMAFEKEKGAKISGPSRKTHDDARACLARKHPFTGKYIGEDFADLLAAKSGASGNLNFACIFWGGTQTSTGQTGLDNANDYDTHSTEIFRALHMEQIIKGSLPKACSDVMGAKKEVVDFSPCI